MKKAKHNILALPNPLSCFRMNTIYLKPLFGRPGPPGLKCTSAAAPTLQQTVACGL